MASSLVQPGAFNLGAILAGGGSVREDAKTAEETRLIQHAALQAATDAKVDAARMAMMKRTGMETVNNDQSVSPLIRALTVGGLGTQYSGATEGQLHQQTYDHVNNAIADALKGNQNDANAELLVKAKGPVALTKVEDGQIVRNQFRDNGTVTPTDVARALAGQHDAAARLSNIKADAGGFAPRTGATGHAGKFTDPSVAALTGIDPADFSQFRTAHPELPDGAEALNAYRAAMPTGPHIIDPSRPGSMTQTPPNLRDQVAARLAGGVGAPMTALDGNIADIERQIGRQLTPREVAIFRATGNVPVPDGEPNIPPPPASVLRAAFAGHAPHAVAHPAVPAAAVEYLRANPHLREAFAAKYGAAAAASILRQ